MPLIRLRNGSGEVIKGAVVVCVAGVVACAVGLAFAAMAIFGVGAFERGTANYRGKTDQINQINGNGKYRIAAYDHFFDLCAAVKTEETAISNTESDIKQTTDPARLDQLQANLTAQKNTRAGEINQYNADAMKSNTEGQFRSSNLPYQLDLNAQETTCTA